MKIRIDFTSRAWTEGVVAAELDRSQLAQMLADNDNQVLFFDFIDRTAICPVSHIECITITEDGAA